MTMRRISPLLSIADWNEVHPIGTLVDYYSILPSIRSPAFSAPFRTRTRSEAWRLADGSPVVLLHGKTGGVHLSHVDVVVPAHCTHETNTWDTSDGSRWCRDCGALRKLGDSRFTLVGGR